uniref:Uncharacterized protein n=1 Tax=viral metagenome TaxID=1070528 RepID=A0A6C0J4S8_9ZZZZ
MISFKDTEMLKHSVIKEAHNLNVESLCRFYESGIFNKLYIKENNIYNEGLQIDSLHKDDDIYKFLVEFSTQLKITPDTIMLRSLSRCTKMKLLILTGNKINPNDDLNPIHNALGNLYNGYKTFFTGEFIFSFYEAVMVLGHEVKVFDILKQYIYK